MRNPVNRLATAAPRAFDSILKHPSTKSDSTTSGTTTEYETRNRGASFDLSMLLNTTAATTTTTAAEQTTGGDASGESSSVDETGSVMTFDATAAASTLTVEDMIQNSSSLDCYLGWNEDGGEVGL